MTNTTNEELAKARAEASKLGCQAILLSSLPNVTYVSSFEVPIPVGAGAENAYGVTMALCGIKDNGSTMIAVTGNAAAIKRQSRLEGLLTFDGLDSFNPTDSRASFMDATRTALKQAGLANTEAVLGVEWRTMPHAISHLLATEFPKLKLINIEDALQQSRLIKTEREIALLRRASEIGDIGHNTLAELCQQAGQTEFEMWADLTQRMYRAVGHDIPITGELVTGPRTCVVNYPGGPRDRRTERGDAVLMDISQRVDGYWSDCTNTHVIGAAATAHQLKYAKASQAACEAAMDTLRPGKLASDVFAAAENAFKQHGLPTAHYAGHQLGVTVNEYPRLVPYDHTPIQAGMVFAVEPGAYEGEGGTFGARSEKIVLVTPSGPEILSKFKWGI